MLEDAKVSYVNSGDNLYGPEGWMDMFRGSAIESTANTSNAPFPALYPPAIWHQPRDQEPVFINQVGACMIYLGDQLGYSPETPAEKARANSILLNALDYISEGRSSFHPVKNSMSYNDQKEEGDKVSKQFSKDRMKKYLHHFNNVIKRRGPSKPVAGGEKVTYADLALFHVLDATVSQFNKEFYDMAWDQTDVPDLKAYYEWMKSRPNIREYQSSDRCPPFAGDSMM